MPPVGEDEHVRFELDERADHEVGALRIAAAIVVVVAGGWLFTLPFGVPQAFAIAGFAFAAYWLRRAALQRARKATQHYLELGREALHLHEGDNDQIAAWSSVESVAIDEDRLVVIVLRKDGSALTIEPQYRGVGLQALGERIQQALEAARQRGGCAPAADG